jgi:hypothetical protein
MGNMDIDSVRPGTLDWCLELNNESLDSINARTFFD